MADFTLAFDVPPYRLSGTVYAALLNHPPQLVALGEAIDQAPYKAAPKAPVLAVKPRHMLVGDGADIVVPEDVPALEIGGTLAIVIGRVACRVPRASALAVVAGYTLAAEVSLPVASHYRPAVRSKARDGFCPIGPRVVPAAEVERPDELTLNVHVDGLLVQESTTGGRARGVAQLIADVTDFMTLQPGDLLLLGAAHGAPLVRAGQSVSISVAGVGALNHRLVGAGVRA